jgi:colicin import membrane protein
MKNKIMFLTLTAALACGLAGCSKNESGTTAIDDANKAAADDDAAAKTAEAAKVEATKIAEATKADAAKTAEAAKVEAAKVAEAAKVEAAKAADNAQAQGLIDKAKNYIAEGKFSDASSALQQLTGLSLTDEQVKLVDDLKEQIQKALAAKAAADAAGSLLKQ